MFFLNHQLELLSTSCWICFSGDFFYGLYHSKSPFFTPHLGEDCWNFFQASKKQIQSKLLQTEHFSFPKSASDSCLGGTAPALRDWHDRWFQILFIFNPIPGEMIEFDEHFFSIWSVQPSTGRWCKKSCTSWGVFLELIPWLVFFTRWRLIDCTWCRDFMVDFSLQ